MSAHTKARSEWEAHVERSRTLHHRRSIRRTSGPRPYETVPIEVSLAWSPDFMPPTPAGPDLRPTTPPLTDWTTSGAPAIKALRVFVDDCELNGLILVTTPRLRPFARPSGIRAWLWEAWAIPACALLDKREEDDDDYTGYVCTARPLEPASAD